MNVLFWYFITNSKHFSDFSIFPCLPTCCWKILRFFLNHLSIFEREIKQYFQTSAKLTGIINNNYYLRVCISFIPTLLEKAWQQSCQRFVLHPTPITSLAKNLSSFNLISCIVSCLHFSFTHVLFPSWIYMSGHDVLNFCRVKHELMLPYLCYVRM